MNQSEQNSILPFNNDQKKLVDDLINSFNEQQLSWFAGYLSGISLPKANQTNTKFALANNSNQSQTPITILVGSRTNNGTSIAKKLKSAAESKGFLVRLEDLNDYSLSKLKDEKFVLVIVSTHGEGVPPIAAEGFYDYIHGKRAPKLDNTKFAVLALGDRSYTHFCKTGKDVDKRLEELGAERMYSRIDCDVDFQTIADSWIKGIISKLLGQNGNSSLLLTNTKENEKQTNSEIKEAVYSKLNPFKTRLLDKIKLNGRGSDKETLHYEISLENSGLIYEPGDALGIYPINSSKLVNELLELLKINSLSEAYIGENKISIEEALRHNYELTTITPDVISKYNEYAKSDKLSLILKDSSKLTKYIAGCDLVDLVTEFPASLSAENLVGTLRKLQPRLYSIASSYKAHPGEVHLTVSTVRYKNSRYKEGACSSYLSDRLNQDQEIAVYLEKNLEFKLPVDSNTPVIMIGPGTGIAPFRSFLQEREAEGAKGKNWLFFGERNFSTDFLYQTELQSYHKKGLLNRLNVAFSRDTEKKVYVQHKMSEHSKEFYSWLENGAYVYVCGDMKNMWKDVNQTIVEIIAKEGGQSLEDSHEYVKQLKKSRRYQVDVY